MNMDENLEQINQAVDKCADIFCNLELGALDAITALSRLYGWVELATEMPEEVSINLRNVFFKAVDAQKKRLL